MKCEMKLAVTNTVFLGNCCLNVMSTQYYFRKWGGEATTAHRSSCGDTFSTSNPPPPLPPPKFDLIQAGFYRMILEYWRTADLTATIRLLFYLFLRFNLKRKCHDMNFKSEEKRSNSTEELPAIKGVYTQQFSNFCKRWFIWTDWNFFICSVQLCVIVSSNLNNNNKIP